MAGPPFPSTLPALFGHSWLLPSQYYPTLLDGSLVLECSAAELDRLRLENAALKDLNRAAADRLASTIKRLDSLLQD